MSPGSRSVRIINGGTVAAIRAEAAQASGQSASGGTSTDAARTIGRYALHAEIASGGMATIHIGRLLGPVGFARTVAIKRLHPPLAKDPEFVAMFLDEARLAARIRHPNVVSTLDVVATEGEIFVVMEYVPGESLARLLRVVRTSQEMVPVPIAATIMVGVLHGLHAAHEARDERGDPLRIVHRDVSPHNILVGTDGDAHVIDFGIAKARGRMQVTRQGQIKGKLSYMPSEQLLGQALDHRADIFAASIVLWEALTGQRLFQGTDDGEVYAKVLLGKVDPPSLHAKDITPAIDALVLKGLARDRNARFATAREMALALEASMPLAPPSQVGRWVETLVGDALAERTEQIAGIERLVDAGDGGGTSSSLVAFGGVFPSPANEQHDVSSPTMRERLPSRPDRTGPTQPVSIRPPGANDYATVVDRPKFASAPPPAVPAIAPPESADSLAGISDAPRRRSRRMLVGLGLLVLPVGAFAAYHELRQESSTTATPMAAKVEGVATTTGAPSGSATPHATIAHAIAKQTDWQPVPLPASSGASEPAPDGAAGSSSANLPKKLAPQGSPTAKTTTPARPASSQGTEAPEPTVTAPPARTAQPGNGSSCDPPYYLDADGTKRYKRYCADR
jgi:eukaryotic-like serine/threonine-protein kinase